LRFFKRKSVEDSKQRRKSRAVKSRLREIGMICLVLAAIGGGVFAGFYSGFFQRTHERGVASLQDFSARLGFRVKDILVTGRVRVGSDELLTRLNIARDMPIFAVDIAGAQKKIADMPWVKGVTIARRLPDTVIVTLEERVPVALWQYNKKISVIDRSGTVLPADDLSSWKDLPLVVGEDAPAHVSEMLAMLDAEPAIASDFSAAVRVGGRRWDIALKRGTNIKLPEHDPELALRRLVSLDEQKGLLSQGLTGVDLRDAEKIIVTQKKT